MVVCDLSIIKRGLDNVTGGLIKGIQMKRRVIGLEGVLGGSIKCLQI